MWLCKVRWSQQIETFRKSSSSTWHLLSCSPCSDTAHKKSKATPLQERKMIDRFNVYVRGGEGGKGCSSYRRSRHARHGTPDGGNGGRGGDVILQCSSAMWDFRGIQHHINGKRGGNGASKNQIGTRGEDKIVQVPVGTVIHLVKGSIPSATENQVSGGCDPWDIPGTLFSNASESSEQSLSSSFSSSGVENMDMDLHSSSSCSERDVQESAGAQEKLLPLGVKSTYRHKVSRYDNVDEHISGDEMTLDDNNNDDDAMLEEDDKVQYNVAELTEHGQQIVIAHGGNGGLGSACCGTGPISDNPSADEKQSLMNAGLSGSDAFLILELKTIADVGLVGMPNAGKSTLLGAISRAKPTVGNYAFTTLRPNIGKVNYDEVSVTVADIPGLIQGAHENRGLGHAFLRHIERTKILAFVVDLAAGLDGRKGIPPWEQLRVLVSELEYYKQGITNRPSLVVANKIDEEGVDGVLEELRNRIQGVPIYPVCAILEEGIFELKDGLRQLVNDGESNELSLKSIVMGCQ
ncbi:hypothetical protein Droror1_Dr00004316 [Drosera rotundifolia]